MEGILPETEAAGSIAKDSVSWIPVSSSACRSRHIVVFSVWSGWEGYPGAGRMPWKPASHVCNSWPSEKISFNLENKFREISLQFFSVPSKFSFKNELSCYSMESENISISKYQRLLTRKKIAFVLKGLPDIWLYEVRQSANPPRERSPNVLCVRAHVAPQRTLQPVGRPRLLALSHCSRRLRSRT